MDKKNIKTSCMVFHFTPSNSGHIQPNFTQRLNDVIGFKLSYLDTQPLLGGVPIGATTILVTSSLISYCNGGRSRVDEIEIPLICAIPVSMGNTMNIKEYPFFRFRNPTDISEFQITLGTDNGPLLWGSIPSANASLGIILYHDIPDTRSSSNDFHHLWKDGNIGESVPDNGEPSEDTGVVQRDLWDKPTNAIGIKLFSARRGTDFFS